METPPAPTLYSATRELHHACEAHPVGQRMSQGIITPQEWADWLEAFRVIHLAVDPILPTHMARDRALLADLESLPAPNAPVAAAAFAASLSTVPQQEGAAYVIHGAHRRGGAVLAKTMTSAGLPTSHVIYVEPTLTENFIKTTRTRLDLAEPARATFQALLATMDEIQFRGTKT
jgi:heme oxygenase